MVLAKTIEQLRAARHQMGAVAFVPTMGALHAGHLSLIQRARALCHDVVVSIFVNPTQFGPREDFTKYPRPIEQDLKLCREAGASMVFNPEPTEIYPPAGPKIRIDLPELTDSLEGKHRPGHFEGVCQVVAKLFNIVQPQYACFGQKDFQQLRILSAMVEALNFPIEIVPCPTLREPDGLAMSSRNRFLSADEHARALQINRALFAADEEVKNGAKVASRLHATMMRLLMDKGNLGHVPFSIDYVTVMDPRTLRPMEQLTGPAVCALAARVGSTRLIDNLLVNETR